MKARYRLFLRRKSVYYAFDKTTKTFESLKTKDKAEATRLLVALNEADRQHTPHRAEVRSNADPFPNFAFEARRQKRATDCQKTESQIL